MAIEPARREADTAARSKAGGDTVERFIRDIEPFFYRRSLIYVDVGAFDGTVFTKFLGSSLAISEAHLIEPNPQSFERLKQVAQEAFHGRSLNLYNVAVGDRRTTVTMKAARSMTRIVDTADSLNPALKGESTFEVECLTLDEMSDRFANGKISILKIDVEGFERSTLAGAHRLFAESRVDVLYIEAGADPQGTQQCYYRDIDDIMLGHGYRMFRIYEQTHEWMEDSPLLRRMNIAYLSPRFAESHPYRLSREFFDTREALKDARSSLSTATKRAAQLESANGKLKEQIEQATTASKQQAAELREQVRSRKAELSAAAKQAAKAEQARQKVEQRLARAKTVWEDRLSGLKVELSARADIIAGLKAEAAALEQRLLESDAAKAELSREVATLERRLSQSEAANAELLREVAELEQRLSQSDAAKAEFSREIAALEQRLLESDAAKAELSREAAELERRLSESEAANAELLREVAELEQRLSQSDAAKAEFSREIAALEQRLSQSDDAAADLSRETTELKQLLSESDEARVELSREAAELVQRLSLSDETIGALNRKAEELQHQLGESEQARQALEEAGRKAGAQARKKLAQLQETLAGKESRIAKLEEQRDRKAEEVRLLKLKVRSIYDSTSWRLAAPLRFVARRLTWLRPKRAKKPGPAALKMSAPTVAKTPVATTAKKEKSPAIVQKAAAKKPARADGKGALPQQARRLEDRLWGGFSRYALAELEALKRSRSSDPVEVAAAARALAGWYTAENDFRRGKENAALARSLTKGKAGREHALVEAHCLVRMGRGADARKVLAPLLAKYPDDPNVLLAMANSYVGSGGDGASDGIRLSWINRIYEKAGLLPLAKADPAGALTIDNLSTPEPDQVDHAAKVSIVVPMFNAAETLAFTLDGIGRQSWRNIEVLLMDDCSTDETLSLAEAFAAADPRFRVVRQERNGGSYSARNRALGLASGDFITIHDAGDWSHPQKIEIQARHLLDNEGVAANHTRWARAFDDLFFTGKFRHKDRILDWNPSSVFFRRSLLEKVGGWDGGVRISADAEFVRRIRIAVPQGNVVSAFDAAPLAFGLDTPSSLTKASATHGRTIFHGLRRDYREASDHWHAQASPEALRLDIGARTRPFPAPAAILCDREIPVRCDVVLIDDFNRGDAVRERALDHVERARAAGRSIALFHWKRYEADPVAPLDARIRQLAFDGKARIVSPGEEVRTRLLLIGSPSVTSHLIDLPPRIEFARLLVLDDGRGPANPQAEANLQQTFAEAGERIAAARVDYHTLHEADPPDAAASKME